MDFDEHEEEQEEEIDMQHQMEAGNSGSSSAAVVSVGSAKRNGGGVVHYKECLKNHAVGIGGHAVDGCCEFMAASEEGTLEALKCAACTCHRNFHRKVLEGDVFHQSHHNLPPPPPPLSSSHHHHPYMAHSIRSPHPMGYLHVTPSQRPLGLPSREEEDDMSNPSSSGGGGGGGGVKRRFRTKFTQEQKEKMGAFAEKLGWRIQKEDEAAVEQFCVENNVRGHVFKVWMHNNKQTLGKKP